MPKKKEETDYSKTVIYKIQCKDPAIKETYGGHSTNLHVRTGIHKSVCNNPNADGYNIYLYQFIRDNGGWNKWEVLHQYNFPCNNREEADIEEERFIQEQGCQLNTLKAHTTKEEARISVNKRARDARKNESPEKREKRLEKERIRDKKRRTNRTEEQKEEQKAKAREHAREKIKCEICNVIIRRDSISKHIKSKTHLKKLEEYNKNQAIKQLDEELAEQLL